MIGTAFSKPSRKQSTSDSVVVGPRLTRIAPRASAGATPMAASTCEGATLPDEQAAPEDTATPSRSKAITAVSAFMPGTANSVVLGSRSDLRPKHDDLGRDRREARARAGRAAPSSARASAGRPLKGAQQRRRRNRRFRPHSRCRRGRRAPARRPDQRIGQMHRLERRISAPTPFGPPILCDGNGHQIGPERIDIARQLARPPGPRRRAGDRPPHAPWWRLPQPVEGRRSRCWRASANRSGRPRRTQPSASPARQIDAAVGGYGNLFDHRRPESARPQAPRDARSPKPAAGRTPAPPAPVVGDSASTLASVPPEVKTTLRGSAPTSAATCSPRLLDQVARRAAFRMDRGRIAAQVQRGDHRGARLRTQRRRRIPVEIDPFCHGFRSRYGTLLHQTGAHAQLSGNSCFSPRQSC